ncbi:transposase [Mesorhizobium caraganae]|uniref:transposase n=1 Tax=Mesorhizobium caraganae TaxID=483206 RepID=UPI0033362055
MKWHGGVYRPYLALAIGATALAASVADPGQFRSGRDFAAWHGLTPSQHSSGERTVSGTSPRQRPVPEKAPCDRRDLSDPTGKA